MQQLFVVYFAALGSMLLCMKLIGIAQHDVVILISTMITHRFRGCLCARVFSSTKELKTKFVVLMPVYHESPIDMMYNTGNVCKTVWLLSIAAE